MTSATKLSGIDQYWQHIQKLQQQVLDTQYSLLHTIAGKMAETILNDNCIYLFGSGHSALLVQEGQLRGGGLAPVIPILVTNLMLHENAMLGSKLERTPGLAQPILDRYACKEGDMLFVYSNSGVNHLPVEMSLLAKEMGMTVVAVCSKKYADVAPLSTIGKRLSEVADYTLDNGGIPGDASIDVPGSNWKVGPTSTLINTLLWQCLVTDTAMCLAEKLDDVPIYASYNLPNAKEHDEKLLHQWRALNPHL
jgi:uncharacterized phosphosugar-binding protein